MINLVKSMLRDESGAVTVDWVALTAGILLLGIAVVYAIFREGVAPLVDAIGTTLSDQSTKLGTVAAVVGAAPTF